MIQLDHREQETSIPIIIKGHIDQRTQNGRKLRVVTGMKTFVMKVKVESPTRTKELSSTYNLSRPFENSLGLSVRCLVWLITSWRLPSCVRTYEKFRGVRKGYMSVLTLGDVVTEK